MYKVLMYHEFIVSAIMSKREILINYINPHMSLK